MFFMFEACLVSVLLVLNMCTTATALSALTEQLKMGGWRQHEPQIASLSRQPPDNSSVEFSQLYLAVLIKSTATVSTFLPLMARMCFQFIICAALTSS